MMRNYHFNLSKCQKTFSNHVPFFKNMSYILHQGVLYTKKLHCALYMLGTFNILRQLTWVIWYDIYKHTYHALNKTFLTPFWLFLISLCKWDINKYRCLPINTCLMIHLCITFSKLTVVCKMNIWYIIY